MKLLSVGIYNLNSLLGKHEVRFDEAPIADAGIFAIVGKTGAGKTTILDAITLALYGKTPRDTNGDEVMSNGTAECYAEVEFSSRSGHYRSKWERRRSRGKLDGKLQVSRREISQLNAEGDWEILEGKIKKEVDRITLQAIGLDYERFTRSVMLTQGEFARFLRAKDNERADLLESITGTEIYRQLSTAAFDRHQLARLDYDRLKDRRETLSLLRTDDRRALEQEAKELETLIGKQRKTNEQLQQQLDRLDQLLALQQQLLQEQAQLKLLEESDEAAKIDRERLLASQRLQPLAAQMQELEGQQSLLAKTLEEVTTLDMRSKQTAAKLLELAAVQKETKSKLAQFEKDKPAKAGKIKDAEALQVQIDDRRKLLSAEKELYAEALLKRKAGEQSRDLLLSQIKDLEVSNRALTLQLANISAPQGGEWAKTDNQLLTQQLQTEEQQLQQEIQQLEALQEYRNLLRLEVRREDELEDIQQELASLDQAFLIALESVQEAQKERQLAEEALNQLLQSQQVVDLRKSLEKGEECPVCGSTEHPALVHWTAPSDKLIERAKNHSEQAKQFFNLQEEKMRSTAQLQMRLATRLATKQEDQEELQIFTQRLQRLEQHFAGPDDPLSTADQSQRLNVQQERLTAVRKLSTVVVADHGRQTQLAEKREEIAAIDLGLNASLQEQERLLKSSQELQTAIQERNDQIKEILGGLDLADAKVKLDQAEAKQRNRQQQAELALKEAQTAMKGQKDELARLTKNRKDQENKSIESKKKLDASFKKLGIKGETAARQILLSIADEQALADRLQQLDLKLTSSREVIQRLDKQAALLVTKTKAKVERPELHEELRSNQQAFESYKERIGALQQQLSQDDLNRKDAGKLMQDIDKSVLELSRWQRLNELIGQKDGGKFRNFAQGLTLARLVQLANRHLQRLNGRYLIHKPEDQDLSLEIIDTFQADNRRPTSTLSGGESFILSLALALGLSDLAGRRTRIESLFIDEGFGTLDSSSLELVMGTLENLRAEGKTIGLISHVPALRERIHHQIRLRAGQEGFSRLEIV